MIGSGSDSPSAKVTANLVTEVAAAFGETSAQLLADVWEPLAPQPGRPRWHVAITQRRTMHDFAHQMYRLVDEAYPDAPVVRVVLDNLHGHRMVSLYETFQSPEARRIAKWLEFHHTHKHASWLYMAEIEFRVLARTCLRGRNPDEDALHKDISAYEAERNEAGTSVDWRFTTKNARTKRRRLYLGTAALT